MKEYKCFKIGRTAKRTERELNILAAAGWNLVCSYAYDNNYLIMERNIEVKQ